MNKLIRPLKRSENNRKWAIASSHCPKAKNSQAHKSLQQRANIPSTNATHVPEECAPIAYAPQESIGVWNALVTTLPAMKTIFQHQADFCQKMAKNGVPMGSISHDVPGISVATILSFKSSLSSLKDI